ncbi:hypothetical protein [Massilia eburnea]|uniref:hypothetical protein n=1 Tax=Massilia eburnea TaxID=1776165 RepID=UPI003D6B5155
MVAGQCDVGEVANKLAIICTNSDLTWHGLKDELEFFRAASNSRQLQENVLTEGKLASQREKLPRNVKNSF